MRKLQKKDRPGAGTPKRSGCSENPSPNDETIISIAYLSEIASLDFWEGGAPMWERFRRAHPRLYEAVEWGVLALSAGTFLLAFSIFWERWF